MADYPIDQMHLIQDELASEERIRWTGRPHSWRFVPVTIPRFIFGIVVAAAVLPHLMDALREHDWGARLFSLLFTLPFVLIGLVLLSSPLRAVRKARRTLYVVTNRRAITFYRGIFSTSIRSFGPEQLIDLRRDEKENGSGDITLMSALKDLGRTEAKRHRAFGYAPGFYGIENVKQVEAMLKDVAAHADAPGESPYTEKETD
ncbi:MAG TPA: hypothetical protein VMZ92_12675 [Planctomycetota bacterium]|nr:hypothetical protein [Planctomycetota bacterium]